MPHNFKSIAVIMGGWSNEREVSLESGSCILKALSSTPYTVTGIDVKKDLKTFISDIEAAKPDVIINALHGTGGEDGVIQGVLTMLGIPFTHSSVLASAIAMDKLMSRFVLSQLDIPFAPYQLLLVNDYRTTINHPFDFPYVIKPTNEGSSRGVSIIRSDADKESAMKTWVYGDAIIAEKYIPGREINVAVIQGKAIGAIELKPYSGFYDYEAKYTEGKTQHIMPAPLTEEDQALLYTYAEKAHAVLGCKCVTRSDFRLDETQEYPNRIAMLEINTQPGMTPLSLVPEIAAYHGISYMGIIEILLEGAACPA